MIIVAGRLHVDPDGRDRYLDGCVDVVRQARGTDGCRDFSLSADLLDRTRINVLELWSTREQLLAFRGAGEPPPGLPAIVEADVHEYEVDN